MSGEMLDAQMTIENEDFALLEGEIQRVCRLLRITDIAALMRHRQ
jgi:hypothetical protein